MLPSFGPRFGLWIQMNRPESPDKPRPREYASSPCSLHEFETPVLDLEDVFLFLNELIEGERAGARGILEMEQGIELPAIRSLLHAVAEDEARFCAMLSHHVERLGGEPSRVTGAFADKLARRRTLAEKLDLLDRGQSVVVRMLDETIPRIADAPLREALTEMRDIHVVNIERCKALAAEGV